MSAEGGRNGGVVRGERQGREGGPGERLPQLGVRGHAADDGDPLGAHLLRRLPDAADERADDRPLVGGGKVGAAPLEHVGLEPPRRVQERGLQPGEGEVEAGDSCDREVVGGWVARFGEQVDLPASRVAEAEQACSLVEGLAGGVVARRAEQPLLGVALHVDEHRVAAARKQAEKRQLDRIGLQVERGDVAVEVVDRMQREAPRPGDRLCRGETDEQRADQAGASSSDAPAC